jgi:hypothetical protein
MLREIELHEVGQGMCYIAIASLLRTHPGWLSHTPKSGLNTGVSRLKRLDLVQRSRESQIKEDQLPAGAAMGGAVIFLRAALFSV